MIYLSDIANPSFSCVFIYGRKSVRSCVIASSYNHMKTVQPDRMKAKKSYVHVCLIDECNIVDDSSSKFALCFSVSL